MERTRRCNVALVDNDPLTLDVLKNMIPMLFPCYIKWCSILGKRAISLCLQSETRPDLLIIDISLTDMEAMSVCQQLRESGEDLPILCITAFPPQKYADEVAKSGAQGILMKSEMGKIKAVSNLLLQGSVMNNMYGKIPFRTGTEACKHAKNISKKVISKLSPSESRALSLYAEGYPFAEIATKMHVTPSTVRGFIFRAKNKLNAKNLSQAIVIWFQMQSRW